MSEPLRLAGPAPAAADGRFAPSPSGPLHLGNLRTALLAWLFARGAGARFLVRIEDLDPGRSREEHVTGQLADLAAIGLDWDEEPVRQSGRGEHYAAAIQQLEAQGLVYPCWCTRAEIRAAVAAPHGDEPEGAYPGTCRDLTPAQRAERASSGRPPALRLRAGGARHTVTDRVHGVLDGVVDDMVLHRGDGAFAYNLGVVVDDAAQGIGEVVRGDDLLACTPGQAWLGERLGLRTPGWAHVPLVRGYDGARLAKRHGAVTLADQAAAGHQRAAVRARLGAELGLIEPGEPASPALLVERFRERVLSAEVTA